MVRQFFAVNFQNDFVRMLRYIVGRAYGLTSGGGILPTDHPSYPFVSQMAEWLVYLCSSLAIGFMVALVCAVVARVVKCVTERWI